MNSMTTLLKKEMEDLKTSVMEEVYHDVGNAEERSLLRSLSEAEALEMYNRRENVRIVGIEEFVERNAISISLNGCQATFQNILTTMYQLKMASGINIL